MNRHPVSDLNLDCREGPGVDLVCDFDKDNLPFPDGVWDAVLSIYNLEHISYRRTPAILKEVWRVLKPLGKAIFIVPNTEAQMEWIKTHPDGWDGKGSFESASEVLMGSQDYSANSHKVYLSPTIVMQLFQDAGFCNVCVQPYGERATDMSITAGKPDYVNAAPVAVPLQPIKEAEPQPNAVVESAKPEQLFDRAYFNGGSKWGGYAREGLRDFACHEMTAKYVLLRKPASVLELGAARGYILKKIEDAGIPVMGLEVSKHCVLTRVCDKIQQADLCKAPWPILLNNYRMEPPTDEKQWDLAFSIATLEHIPESALPVFLSELKRVSRRGLHGIDFGAKDDNWDKTHVTLKPQAWWRQKFNEHGLQSHEIVDKESLEAGNFPAEVLAGDGKVKLNIGCGMNMFYHGWTNLDAADLVQFAQQNSYRFILRDMRKGIPFSTGTVDLIFADEFLPYLTYKEGETFLKECRRVLKPDGAMRLVVTDAENLAPWCYDENSIRPVNMFDEMNQSCANARTSAGKLHALLCEGRASIYDSETIMGMLADAGFKPEIQQFRKGHPQILCETTESDMGGTSLFMDAVPLVG